MKLISFLLDFLREEEGQDLIEYALLASFLSIAAAVGATAAGTALDGWYNALSTRVGAMATAVAG